MANFFDTLCYTLKKGINVDGSLLMITQLHLLSFYSEMIYNIINKTFNKKTRIFFKIHSLVEVD
jgi:hypothetical protein